MTTKFLLIAICCLGLTSCDPIDSHRTPEEKARHLAYQEYRSEFLRQHKGRPCYEVTAWLPLHVYSHKTAVERYINPDIQYMTTSATGDIKRSKQDGWPILEFPDGTKVLERDVSVKISLYHE